MTKKKDQESSRQIKAEPPRKGRSHEREDVLIDEAVDGSFPASDPPSYTRRDPREKTA